MGCDKACNIVQQLENVHKQLAGFSSQAHKDTSQAVKRKDVTPRRSELPFTCYRCGNQHFSVEECRYKRIICHQCGKSGHSTRVWPSKACTAATSRLPKKPVK
ncbi:unnamed protein product, partial [Dicrocoelium dendriticum]